MKTRSKPCRTIPPADYPRLFEIAAEYLPGTTPQALEEMCKNFLNAVVGYYLDDTLVGVCYGMGVDDTHFSLDGITIVQPHNAQGWGGELLAFFERQVAALGYKKISLGSADGYVERFYLKNGLWI